MKQKGIFVYCGTGTGKSAMAVGRALRETGGNKTSIIIQFMKGKYISNELLERLEPEIRFFRFEKFEKNYRELSSEEKQEEIRNIQNGLNFSRKVIQTRECDILVLDEILGLLELEIISEEELMSILTNKNDEMQIILTGTRLPENLAKMAEGIVKVEDVLEPCVDNRL